MQVEFYSSFDKDISKVKLQSVKDSIAKQIISVENCESLADFIQLPNVTKLVGHIDCYRIKFGDYRIGVRVVNNVVHFARFGTRANIYSLFP